MAQCVVFAPRTDTEVGAYFPDYLQASSVTPCPGYVLLTPAEFEQVGNNPFNLSAEDGATLAAAIVSVWAAAWAWRALFRSLDHGGEVSE